VIAVPGHASPLVTAATYGCACGHGFKVYGRDRHRRYYEYDDAAHVDPVMTRVCPICERRLPGKNLP
jgi:hypothetical protein